VDEALDAVRDKAADQEPLQDLTSQVAYLRDTSRQASSGVGRSISGKLRTRVQAQPLKATLVVGLLAFLYGAIPREIQDILTIKPGERHRWLADGGLPSAGTRTVRLAGRAKQITVHVFDPRVVEDLLDTGVVDQWREEDAKAATENRRRAAYKAKLTRSLQKGSSSGSPSETGSDEASGKLAGWEEFGRDGFLL